MSLPIQSYADRNNSHFSGVASGEKHMVFARDYFAIQPVMVQTAVVLTENWIEHTAEDRQPLSWLERLIHPKAIKEATRTDILRKIAALFLAVLKSHGSPESVALTKSLLDYVRYTPQGRAVWSVFSQFYTQASIMSVLYLNGQPGAGADCQQKMNVLHTLTAVLPTDLRRKVLKAASDNGFAEPPMCFPLAGVPGIPENTEPLAKWETLITEQDNKCANAGKPS